MRKERVSQWADPDEVIDSGYGRVTFREWCELELARMRKHGDRVKLVVRKSDGFIAISR